MSWPQEIAGAPLRLPSARSSNEVKPSHVVCLSRRGRPARSIQSTSARLGGRRRGPRGQRENTCLLLVKRGVRIDNIPAIFVYDEKFTALGGNIIRLENDENIK